jgi:glycine C-acetyltransferase
MLSSYSYLGLLGHPQIEAAAKEAIDRFSTGTHGVRLLAGTLTLHNELEQRIARFKDAEAAIVYSSGYVTNLSTISTLVRRGDLVICDKLNHASIVDGCLLSGAKFLRFRHNDMEHLERRLAQADPRANKLVVVDAVFSMDGDIINLPEVSRLCRQYGALLMVDEAHSLGVLGQAGHGIEEHFGLPSEAVDVKMGTLSKTIPSVGGYVASSARLIELLKHQARGFIFSAALPPAQTGAALAAFDVIEREPERIASLQHNMAHFRNRLRELGFDTLNTESAIVPIICGEDEKAWLMARLCQDEGLFVHGIPWPVVPQGTARLRCIVTAAHTLEDVEFCLEVIERAGRSTGVI